MSILGKILGEGIAKPVEAVGSVLDKLFTSDEERLTKQEALERLKNVPVETLARVDLAQAQTNTDQAKSNLLFVAGARPFIMWGLGAIYMLVVFVNSLLIPFIYFLKTGIVPHVNTYELAQILLGMLGLSVMRSFDKKIGTTETYGVNLPPPEEIRHGNKS